jgi:hypothetical protein
MFFLGVSVVVFPTIDLSDMNLGLIPDVGLGVGVLSSSSFEDKNLELIDILGQS